MSGTATITAPTGAGSSVSALQFTAIRNFNIDCLNQMISVQKSDGTWVNFDAHATSTCTVTASSGVFTITVSQ